MLLGRMTAANGLKLSVRSVLHMLRCRLLNSNSDPSPRMPPGNPYALFPLFTPLDTLGYRQHTHLGRRGQVSAPQEAQGGCSSSTSSGAATSSSSSSTWGRLEASSR